ncbi:hypothetical protein HYQ46_013086 [Verticillium longisporum]|nr:hypothetical protein HYQ46_013086 [Verticillium longisporum]
MTRHRLRQNTALKSESRIKSGANPRTKLTEGELTERLEKMAILSAEKARKHELSEADERTHAAAYAHGAGDLAGDENYRGRGRGRGRGGSNRGRGGRGGNLNGRDGAGASASTPSQATNKPILNTADFPALPSVDSKFSPDSPTGPLNWGEEMESLDAKLAGKDQ